MYYIWTVPEPQDFTIQHWHYQYICQFEFDARRGILNEPRSVNQTMVVLHIYRVACSICLCSLGWSIFRLEVLCFGCVKVCTIIMQNTLHSNVDAHIEKLKLSSIFEGRYAMSSVNLSPFEPGTTAESNGKSIRTGMSPQRRERDRFLYFWDDSFTPMTKSSQFAHSSMTKYGKSDSGISALTPSSTFPVSHGKDGKETSQRREGWTPSSTLPSPPPALESDTIHNRVATNPPTIPPVSVPAKGHQNKASQTDPVQSQVTSKPPMDPSANRRREKEQQQEIGHQFLVNPEQPPNPSPEDVVVMKEDRRFKKLKLLGCGGSSRVGQVFLTLDLFGLEQLLVSCNKGY